MDKKMMIEELESYKYDYEYFFERFNNAKKLDEVISQLDSRIKEIYRMGFASDSKLNKQLLNIKEEQIEEERVLLAMLSKKRKIERMIDSIGQPYRSVLLYKYISLYTFDEIALKMHYSTKRIYQLHKKGIELYCSKCEEFSSD